jgi:hypothetical protein
MCTNTAFDPTNCGACGTVCAGAANATAACGSGVCGTVCNSGFGNCNGLASDGCETNLNTSASNCGTCGNVCAGGGSCFSGSCTPHCNTAPPRILIYGSGGTASQPFFPAGSVVTVASDAMWNSMTTANFGDYDVIWVDSNACSGGTGYLATLRDTQPVWGPAIRGRIAVMGVDADFHAPFNGAAQTYIRNHASWLAGMGHNSGGGFTGLYLSGGCSMGDTTVQFPDTFQATLGSPFNGSGGFSSDPGTVTAAGTTHPVLAGLDSGSLAFHSFAHGAFPAVPASYTALVLDFAGPPNLVVRNMACVP